MGQSFPGGSVVKNSPANARDTGLIPRLGRSLGVGNGNPVYYCCWKIPWTEEPARLQSSQSQRVGHHEPTEHIGLLWCDVFPVTV